MNASGRSSSPSRVNKLNRVGLTTRSIQAGMAMDADTRAIRRPLVMANNYEVPRHICHRSYRTRSRHPDFGGPHLVRLDHPTSIRLGADLIMHSLSKYTNGHGDAIGEDVLGPKEILDRVRLFVVKDFGGCISPFNAWQIMRGANTLPLKIKRHCEHAMQLAQSLESHSKVDWMHYPGLKSHLQHDTTRKQMDGFSGMLNFDIIEATPAGRAKLVKRLGLFSYATCLGHDESLILDHDDYKGHEFFRVSVGLKDPQDLIADIDQLLEVA